MAKFQYVGEDVRTYADRSLVATPGDVDEWNEAPDIRWTEVDPDTPVSNAVADSAEPEPVHPALAVPDEPVPVPVEAQTQLVGVPPAGDPPSDPPVAENAISQASGDAPPVETPIPAETVPTPDPAAAPAVATPQEV